jgi:hypothetical protein
MSWEGTAEPWVPLPPDEPYQHQPPEEKPDVDTIDKIRFESDENGWELVLEGDFVETFQRYLASDTCVVRLNMHGVAFDLCGTRGMHELLMWAAEGRAAQREVAASADDGDGYALDDPKHPTYHDRMSGHADL